MAKAKVTLVGPASLAIGRYRFERNNSVIVNDLELLKYCKVNSSLFTVEMLQEEAPTRLGHATATETGEATIPRRKIRAKRSESENEIG